MAFKILVPTDLSQNSLPALQLAMTLAQPLEATIELLHVVDARFVSELPVASPSDVQVEKQRVLEQAEKARAGLLNPPAEGVLVNVHTRSGTPWEEICNEADMLNADLVVLSTHGRTGLSHLLMGSVTEHVVRSALSPVLTLRTGGDHLLADASSARTEAGEDEAPLPLSQRIPQRLLVATDLSESSLPALKLAAALADRFGASVTLVHVLDMAYTSVPLLNATSADGDLQTQLVHRAGDALRAFLEKHADTLGDRILEAPVLLQLGEAASELVQAARETATDLIVLGRHGYTGFRRFLMGSVAEAVVRQAPCPVLTIPIIPE